MRVSPGESSSEQTDADGGWNSVFKSDSVTVLSGRVSFRVAPGRDFAQTGKLFSRPGVDRPRKKVCRALATPINYLPCVLATIYRNVRKHSSGMLAASSSFLVPAFANNSSFLQALRWNKIGESEPHGA